MDQINRQLTLINEDSTSGLNFNFQTRHLEIESVSTETIQNLLQLVKSGAFSAVRNRNEIVKILEKNIAELLSSYNRIRDYNPTNRMVVFVDLMKETLQKIESYSSPEADTEDDLTVESEKIPEILTSLKKRKATKSTRLYISERRDSFTILYDVDTPLEMVICISFSPKLKERVDLPNGLIANHCELTIIDGNVYYLLENLFRRIDLDPSVITKEDFQRSLEKEMDYLKIMRGNGMGFSTYPKILLVIQRIVQRVLTSEHLKIIKDNPSKLALKTAWHDAYLPRADSVKMIDNTIIELRKNDSSSPQNKPSTMRRSNTPSPKQEKSFFRNKKDKGKDKSLATN